MSTGNGKRFKISHIVRIRQMLRRWRRKAAGSTSSPSQRITQGRVPSDVPSGHVAICVGSSRRRFVMRATYLNHPIFQKLLVQAEEEYGFENAGPLTIPCDEFVFEEILGFVSQNESTISAPRITFEDFQRCRLVDFRKINFDVYTESRPLLGGYADKTIC